MKKLMMMMVFVCAACGGGDDVSRTGADPDASTGPGTNTDAGSVATGIGPAGGTVSGPDGSYVIVPAGALSETVSLAIASGASDAPALPDGVALAGVVYTLTPHGTRFAVPALLHVPYDASKLVAGQTPSIYKAEVGGSYAALTTTRGEGFLEASIDGFSYAAPASPNLSEGAYSALSGQCARRALSGVVDCWGNLEYLAQTESSVPVTPTPVAGGRAFGQFASSPMFVCGVSGTELWCAGDNQYGQLGNGSSESSATGVKVLTPAGVALRDVTLGYQHACALVASSDPEQDGHVYCWGSSGAGQVGAGGGPVPNYSVPTAVASPYRYANVHAAGRTTCATRSTGEVDCWGNNANGQFGRGYDATGSSRVPVLVPGVTALAQTGALTGGGDTFCALTATGTMCWGYNVQGTVGDGTQGSGSASDPLARKAPSVVAGGHRFARLASSSNATCGSEASGATFCWGVVTDVNQPWLTPQPMSDLPNSYKELTGVVGNRTFCGITTDTNKTYCWGGNTEGELGSGQATVGDAYGPPQPLPNQ